VPVVVEVEDGVINDTVAVEVGQRIVDEAVTVEVKADRVEDAVTVHVQIRLGRPHRRRAIPGAQAIVHEY
jgi:hypothetical protein